MTEITGAQDAVRIAFVCVRNAGRSQMAHAFGKREVTARGLDDAVELLMGGTRPADHVHEAVVEAMAQVGIDIADRTPREITFEETRDSDYLITMGCSADDICPASWAGENRDWDLDDPKGKAPHRVREIRDEIAERVSTLFDEIEAPERG
ncbi:MAG: low molecular weight phosphatase family protein [Halodesulfurarchaeum sp.]